MNQPLLSLSAPGVFPQSACSGLCSTLWVPLDVVREISCGRAVNYSSWVLKGAGAHAAFRSLYLYQDPVGSCGPFIRQAWKLQPANLSDMQHIKRLFSVQREKMNKRWWIQFWGRAKGIQSSNHGVITKLWCSYWAQLIIQCIKLLQLWKLLLKPETVVCIAQNILPCF